jgi:hypothetical protein
MAQNCELGLGIPGKAVWMRDYWERYIRDEEHFRAVVQYIHENPVKGRSLPCSGGMAVV